MEGCNKEELDICRQCGQNHVTCRCAGCQKEKYCSLSCFLDHWNSGHKEECPGGSKIRTPQYINDARVSPRKGFRKLEDENGDENLAGTRKTLDGVVKWLQESGEVIPSPRKHRGKQRTSEEERQPMQHQEIRPAPMSEQQVEPTELSNGNSSSQGQVGAPPALSMLDSMCDDQGSAMCDDQVIAQMPHREKDLSPCISLAEQHSCQEPIPKPALSMLDAVEEPIPKLSRSTRKDLTDFSTESDPTKAPDVQTLETQQQALQTAECQVVDSAEECARPELLRSTTPKLLRSTCKDRKSVV